MSEKAKKSTEKKTKKTESTKKTKLTKLTKETKLTWGLLCPKNGKDLALSIVLGLLAPYAYLMLCGLIFDRWLRLYGMTTFIFFSYAVLQALGIAVVILSIRSYLRKKKGKDGAVPVVECAVAVAIALAIIIVLFAGLMALTKKDSQPQTRDVVQSFAGTAVEPSAETEKTGEAPRK